MMNNKCKNGHARTEDNIKVYKNGKRRCIKCQKNNVERAKERRHANRDKQITKDALPANTPAILEHYKEPLRKVEKGFGYYGTIAYDEATRSKTQCQICGLFFSSLHAHISHFHRQTVEAYKKEFKLPKNISLSAPKKKEKAFERWAKMTDEEKQAHFDMMNKARDKKKAYKKGGGKTLYRQNLEGTCPDQIVDKLQKLAKELGRTPSHKEFERRWKISREAVTGRHGSFAKAIAKANLQPWVEQNSYTPEELIIGLLDFRDNNGREAMTRDIGKNRLPTMHTYIKYFGSFTEAKRAAYQELERVK